MKRLDPNRVFASSALARAASALIVGDSGVAALMFAFCGSMIFGAMAVMLVIVQVQMTESNSRSAADITALSIGSEIAAIGYSGGAPRPYAADGQGYYESNSSSGYMNALTPTNAVNVVLGTTSSGGVTVKVTTTTTMTPLMKLSHLTPFTGTVADGSSQGTLTASPDTVSETQSSTALVTLQKTLEVVMVLDNTGSMGESLPGSSTSKIQGLKTAANTLVSDLLTNPVSDTRVGLVPFTTTVNLTGALPSNGSWLSPVFSYNPAGVQMTADSSHPGWGGCAVEPRDPSGYLYPKAYGPLDPMKFTPYYYNTPPGGITVRNYKDNTCSTVSSTQTIANVPFAKTGYPNQCGFSGSDVGNGIAKYFDKFPQGGGISGTATQNSDCISHPVTFLTADQNTLTSSINTMVANGSTIVPEGILWGWRMLSSAWADQISPGNGWISTDPSYPKPETSVGLQRVMIVLTDGENQVGGQYSVPNDLYFNGLSGVGRQDLAAPTVFRASDGTSMVNARMDNSENVPLASNGVGNSSDINNLQLGICNAVKKDGVIVYSITFGNVSATAAKTMQACASPGNYYNAPTTASLNTIFSQIAGSLGGIRLIQ